VSEAVVGGRADFAEGICGDDGCTLRPGKENWCVPCHDSRPSASHYDADPETVVPPFIVEYDDANVTYSIDSGWIDRNWSFAIGHKRATASNSLLWRNAWVTYDFMIPQDGNYAINMKWDVANSNCYYTTRPALVIYYRFQLYNY